ncbi:MAG: hypothetical protein EOM37_19595 [Proteobacteria bacterium]|nr:hypothetical protein [Pseudomonadota bacterium]
MTPTLWTAFREFIGLSGQCRVTEIPSETLAMFFLSSPWSGEDVIAEQEWAELGRQTPRRNHAEV